MQSVIKSLMSNRCERSLESMMPAYHPGDTHTDASDSGSEKLSVPTQQGYPNMLSDFNTPYLGGAPMLTFTDNYEDLDLSTACGQWDSLDPGSSPIDSSLSDGLYLDTTVWGQCLDLDLGSDALDEVLTGSKEALGNGPTLAALNASEKPELGDLDLDDFPLPEEISSQIRGGSGLNTPLHDSHDCLSIPMLCGSGASSNGPVAAKVLPKLELHSGSPKLGTTLHELLVQERSSATTSSVAAQMVPQDVKISVKDEPLSPQDHFSDLQKRWPRMRLRTCTLTSLESFGEETAHSNSSVSDYSEDIKAEVKDNDSHDEGFDSDLEDSDHYNDYSDADSVGSWDLSRNACSPTSLLKSRKKERYFWQYNLQAKGPKGNRMPLAKDALDPHMLDEVTDPVFSPSCQVKGIKHTGKARRGDGNDLTPNPMKLYQIGQELRKLNRVINDLTPVSELPFSVRPKSRKEKNKLASRACRLKKKAQHEANKLKLFGLEQEHRRLMYVLAEMRKSMLRHTGEIKPKQGELMQKYENLTQHFLKTKVAGNTVEFVNRVLESVSVGNSPSLEEKCIHIKSRKHRKRI